jgi:hypothetical protein
MYLPAVSIGYAVPGVNFDTSVHSTFQSALNLRLKGEGGLLTLIPASEGDLPQGIRLETPEGFSFEEFQTGETALCRDGILRFENGSLTVQLTGANLWKCDLPALGFDHANPAVSAAWTRVWDALNKRQRLSASEIVAEELLRSNESVQVGVAHRVGKAMRDLLNTTQRYELTNPSTVESLIGLGPGLTPSGDDLLVGYITGLWCTAKDRNERVQFISGFGRTIIDLSEKTNDISRTYLYHAVRGQVSSRLANLAEAICTGDNSKHLHETAQTSMSVGHTSGMEVVTGLLMGLAAWEGNRLLSI